MKLKLFVGSLFLVSTTGWTHGNIEEIKCEDASKRVALIGEETSEPGTLRMKVLQAGKTIVKPKKIKISLKDELKESLIIENIGIDFGSQGKALLKIPEIAQEKRPGKGTLSLKSPGLEANLSCNVVY